MYHLPFETVLYDMSYVNLTMYSAVLPTYDSDKDKGKKNEEIINADNKNNSKKIDDFFNSITD